MHEKSFFFHRSRPVQKRAPWESGSERRGREVDGKAVYECVFYIFQYLSFAEKDTAMYRT